MNTDQTNEQPTALNSETIQTEQPATNNNSLVIDIDLIGAMTMRVDRLRQERYAAIQERNKLSDELVPYRLGTNLPAEENKYQSLTTEHQEACKKVEKLEDLLDKAKNSLRTWTESYIAFQLKNSGMPVEAQVLTTNNFISKG